MKFVLVVALVMLCISHTQAQPFFRDRMPQRPPISVATACGITSCSLGVVSLAIGGLIYLVNASSAGSSNSSYSQSDQNTSYLFLGTGAVLAIAGGILIGAGTSHNHEHSRRWSAVAPKRNELGLAYNF